MDEFHLNIGSAKSCCFVEMSTFLIKRLEERPLLFYAIEEALECAKLGYYGIGIIAFAQLLQLFDEKTPQSRHAVAHNFLERQPTKEMLDAIITEFKSAAARRSSKERTKTGNAEEYQKQIVVAWANLMQRLHGVAIQFTDSQTA